MREYAPKDRMKGGEIEPLITHPENCGCCYFFSGKGGEPIKGAGADQSAPAIGACPGIHPLLPASMN